MMENFIGEAGKSEYQNIGIIETGDAPKRNISEALVRFAYGQKYGKMQQIERKRLLRRKHNEYR